MRWAIRVHLTRAERDRLGGDPRLPLYVESYDVEAFDGRGTCTFTSERDRAATFDAMSSAVEAWQTTSKVRPVRADGKPNRPLTHFTIEFERVPDYSHNGEADHA